MTDFSMQSPLGPRVTIAGRERDYFSGTGYLGLQNHPLVLHAAHAALDQYGLATGTSRGGYGEHPVYAALEAQACAFFAAETVLYYPSGYMSGLILAQGLGERYERIFLDEWAHYSLWDAARSTRRPCIPFRHADPQALREALRSALQPGERPLLLSDGVFPISGEIAPAAAYQAVLADYAGAWLCLDDAHATGVLGPHGRGTLDYFGLTGAGLIAGHTLSKGIGGYGGVIAGSGALLAELDRNSRVYVGASPPPLPVAAASRQALALAEDPQLRQQLWENVARARSGLRQLGWDLADTPVPILCLGALPGVDLARLKNELFAQNICVAHVTNYSSTPPGGALRIAIFANHTKGQIDRLVTVLGQLL